MLAFSAVAAIAALAFANGANDVSKGVATLVGSGVTGYRPAIAWGTVWTALGALLGASVAGAMLAAFGKGLLAPGVSPTLGAALATLAGAGAWVGIATWTGLPVSTTHALVGALIGSAVSAGGPGAVAWSALGAKILLPLLVSPVAAFLLTGSLVRALRLGGPLAPPASDCLCADLSPGVAGVSGSYGAVVARQAGLRLSVGPSAACDSSGSGAVRLTLGHLQWAASAATSFARGMNDAPKMVALGLAAATLALPARVQASTLYLAVALGMSLGGMAAGRRVTHLLAERVTPLDPASGLAASGVTALLVAAGAAFGLPMSTTHVASGGIAGVGAVHGSNDLATLRHIALAWVVTLPASAALAAAAGLVARVLAPGL